MKQITEAGLKRIDNMFKQELTNEEIAKVFAMYGSSTFTESEGNISGSGPAWYVVYKYVEDYLNDLSPYKLLLTPLSRISDEDAIEVVQILKLETKLDNEYMLSQLKGFMHNHDIFYWFDLYRIKHIKIHFIMQYLISKGYAVPLFFAPNHWANGKTAIEIGIAIETPSPKPN